MKIKLIIVVLLSFVILLNGCQKDNSGEVPKTDLLASQISELAEIPKKLLVESKALIEDTKEYIVAMDIPDISIPGFENVEKNLNDDMTRFANKSVTHFKEKVEQLEDKASQAYIGMDYYVTSNENEYFSISLLSYDYYGGTEVMTYRRSFNYHIGDLRRLTLEDLLGEEYITIINSEIKQQISDSSDLKNALIDEFVGINNETGFYLSDGKLIVFFDQKDLFDYQYGIPEFEIPETIYQPYSKID